MELGDVLVGVVLQRVADEVDVLVVVLAEVTLAGTDGTDTQTFIGP